MVTEGMLARLQRKLGAKLRSIVRRGTLTNSDSSGQGQTLQMGTLADDVRDDVEHMEPYGFTSHPPAGSEGLVFNVGGDTGHVVALNVGSRGTRVAGLAAGEVALYHQNGVSLQFFNDQTVELAHPTGARVTILPSGVVEVVGTPTVALGGAGGLATARSTDPVATTVTLPSMATLQAALAAWVPVATDGGAALKTALAAFLALPTADIGSGVGTITAGGTGSTST